MLDGRIEEILRSLNDEQKEAVKNYKGASFLLAGPGSGKTRVLVERTKYMILEGVEPSNILLFTFTNKAATEIRERINNSLGKDTASKLTIGTYHSFCCSILRKYASKIGYINDFNIIDSDDSLKIANRIMNGTGMNAKDLLAYISHAKRDLITPQKAMEEATKTGDTMAQYYSAYQAELTKQYLFDFDDLIFSVIKILKNNPDVLEKINRKYRYITCDESHDSSSSDLELIRLLAGKEQNVCFIVDPNQSIYGFRGANITAVLNIQNVYNDLKIFQLNRNYRCSNVIVEASKSLIAKNTQKLENDMYSMKHDGEKILRFDEDTAQKEAVRVAVSIRQLVQNLGYSYEDIAILYRTNNLSRKIEEALLKLNIPNEIVSGVNFYQRKEIKDIVSYIQLLLNKYNMEAFTRVINTPKRGVGDINLSKIIEVSRETDEIKDVETSINIGLERGLFKGKAKKGIQNFLEIMNGVSDIKDDLTVTEVIEEFIKRTDYYKFLEKENSKDFEERKLNIEELLELSRECVSLEEFIEKTSLNTNMDNLGNEVKKVQLMTIHMSKGLEFPVVFIVGCNEKTIPFFKAETKQEIEEERRLMFVGMTRAEQVLILTRSKQIELMGKVNWTRPSRFLGEIDKIYIDK